MAARRKTNNAHNFAIRVSLARKCQCTTVIMAVYSEFRGPFLRAVLPMKVEVSARAVVVYGKTKALITPPTR